MTWVLIMWFAGGGSWSYTVVGHYRDQNACMDMGYRVQNAVPGFKHDTGNFYCVEDTSPQSR